MKRVIMLSAVLLFVILFQPESAFSQDEMKAKKYENPKWMSVVMIDYKPGKYNRAREIINNYYVKANEKAGVNGPSTVVEMHTGGWDIMAVWEMAEGIESMNWDVSPDNIKWRKALNEIAGGADEAQKILDEYSSYVGRITSNIGLGM